MKLKWSSLKLSSIKLGSGTSNKWHVWKVSELVLPITSCSCDKDWIYVKILFVLKWPYRIPWRFQVLTAASMKVVPCRWNRSTFQTCVLTPLSPWDKSLSETPVNFNEATRRYIPDSCHVYFPWSSCVPFHPSIHPSTHFGCVIGTVLDSVLQCLVKSLVLFFILPHFCCGFVTLHFRQFK
jgi:hypothetical protein